MAKCICYKSIDISRHPIRKGVVDITDIKTFPCVPVIHKSKSGEVDELAQRSSVRWRWANTTIYFGTTSKIQAGFCKTTWWYIRPRESQRNFGFTKYSLERCLQPFPSAILGRLVDASLVGYFPRFEIWQVHAFGILDSSRWQIGCLANGILY